MPEFKELTITRVFNASRERVWRAWTDPTELANWWGPRGVTNPICNVDLRVGGMIHVVMLAGPELGPFAGQRWPMKGTFTEITPPEKLVFNNQAVDEQNNLLIGGVTTVILEEDNGKTTMTLHVTAKAAVPQASQMIEGMEAGWTQSIDKLREMLG
jgi:uncharacterized protein YndB with AHSA1/START domain